MFFELAHTWESMSAPSLTFLAFLHRLFCMTVFDLLSLFYNGWSWNYLWPKHCHHECPCSWKVLPNKNVLFRELQHWNKFPAFAPHFFSLYAVTIAIIWMKLLLLDTVELNYRLQSFALLSQRCHLWGNECNLLFDVLCRLYYRL